MADNANTNPDDELLLKEALNHSWNWFSLHAGQRMQAVNFFLVSTAFITSAFSVAVNADKPGVAAVIAGLGAVITIFFNRLEIRTKELVKIGECALEISQRELSRRTGHGELEILVRAKKPKAPFTSYGDVIPAIQWTVFSAFVAGVIFAVTEAVS